MRRVFAVIGLAAAVLVCVKGAATLAGASALESVRARARHSVDPVGPEDARKRWRRLSSAIRLIPGDPDAWETAGRYLHRAAESANAPVADAIEKSVVEAGSRFSAPEAGDVAACEPSGGLGGHDRDRRARLLCAALVCYERAASANALAAGPRFWGSIARARLQSFSKADETAIDAQFETMEEALALDPVRPDRLRAAGDLALSLGRDDRAGRWYRAALALGLDDLERIVESLLHSAGGIEAAVAVVPDRARAQHRLAEYLADRWRFDEAERAYGRYRELAGAPFARDDDLVQNGTFDRELDETFPRWRIVPAEGARVARARDGGGPALHVRLGSDVAHWFHAWQDIPLNPGGRYRLTVEGTASGAGAGDALGVEAVHPLDAELFAAAATKSYEPGERGGAFSIETEFEVPVDMSAMRIRLRAVRGERRRADELNIAWRRVAVERVPENNETEWATDAESHGSDTGQK
ncbi:hypothetical protein K8I61_15180 [bacterium]|nr:hypothetical protein [bacterium]